ncbi:MAG: Osmosensitive channel histidine kinase KdpD [Labilithrix sp.]|nr:Osmosensitive channel histidine kinase KdpD [Labilithrix sp.]
MRTSTTARRGRSKAKAPGPSADPPTPDEPTHEGSMTGSMNREAPSTAIPSSTATKAATPTSPAPPKKPRGRDPLLAAICHDLRAPLAAVTMGANFVLQTTPEDEASGRSRRVLQAILRSCKQMERLVRDFGDLSEVEGDAVELRLGVHDAAQMLEIAAEGARPNGLARNVTIEVRRPDTPPLLRCDRERMLRALAHVLDNAVRFSPDGGTVAAEVEEHDGDVRFIVTDQGPGIPDETLANLYDRTWHARRAERVGSGLGLAIVRGFLRAHSGTVEVATKAGGPTSFMLVLPKDGAPGASDEPPPPAATH